MARTRSETRKRQDLCEWSASTHEGCLGCEAGMEMEVIVLLEDSKGMIHMVFAML